MVDILQVLIQQPDHQRARNYRKVLKNRLQTEGSEMVTKCNRLVRSSRIEYQAARNYWKVLKNRLNKEGNKSVTKCNRLNLHASDGKYCLTTQKLVI